MDSAEMVHKLLVAQAQCVQGHANYLVAQRVLCETFEGIKSDIEATLLGSSSPALDAIIDLPSGISRLERECNPGHVINAVARLVVHLTSP